MAKKEPEIKIKKDEQNPEPIEILAKSLIEIARGFKRLSESGISRRAIALLVRDAAGNSKITMTEVELVLATLPRLESYIRNGR